MPEFDCGMNLSPFPKYCIMCLISQGCLTHHGTPQNSKIYNDDDDDDTFLAFHDLVFPFRLKKGFSEI